jgi:hypothetical protein
MHSDTGPRLLVSPDVSSEKPVVTRSGSLGTYRQKSRCGVVTVVYSNTKLRKKLGDLLPM